MSFCILSYKKQNYKINMKNCTILFVLIFCISTAFAQSSITVRETVDWEDAPIIHNPTGNFETKIWSFEGATYNPVYPSLPVFSDRRKINTYGSANVEVISIRYESFNKNLSEDDQHIGQELNFETAIFNDRGSYFLYWSL
jgi:hypothetical protein